MACQCYLLILRFITNGSMRWAVAHIWVKDNPPHSNTNSIIPYIINEVKLLYSPIICIIILESVYLNYIWRTNKYEK